MRSSTRGFQPCASLASTNELGSRNPLAKHVAVVLLQLAEIALEKSEIKLSTEDQFKMKNLVEIVIGKIAKRNISLKNVEQCAPDLSPLGHARQVIRIKQGLETEVAKQITGFIRDEKFKVTTQIQDAQVRVTGKSRDELQAVMAAVRAKDFPVAVQFQNFRD